MSAKACSSHAIETVWMYKSCGLQHTRLISVASGTSTVATMLTEIERFEGVLIMATNRPCVALAFSYWVPCAFYSLCPCLQA